MNALFIPIFFGVLLNLFCITTDAQHHKTEVENHKKYWLYRMHLLGNGTDESLPFVVPGLGPGKSLPYADRHPQESCSCGDCSSWTPWSTRRNCKDPDGWCSICDSLQRPGERGLILGLVDATTHLGRYIGMLALEHALLNKNKQDDTPTVAELYYALKAYFRLELAAAEKLGVDPSVTGPGYFVRSDHRPSFIDTLYRNQPPKALRTYHCWRQPWTCWLDNDEKNLVSQDQIYNLLIGGALVAKLVPDSVSFRGESLAALAKEMSDRLLRGLKGTGAWYIQQPGAITMGGGFATAWSFGSARAGRKITGKRYQNPVSLAAIGTFYLTQPTENKVNRTMYFIVCALANLRNKKLYDSWTDQYNSEEFSLLRSILHDVPLFIPQTTFRDRLTEKPAPYFGVESGLGPVHNGLDYLFLYNLYHWYFYGKKKGRDQLPLYQSLLR